MGRSIQAGLLVHFKRRVAFPMGFDQMIVSAQLATLGIGLHLFEGELI
jgi:hypothetical protein